MAEVDPITGRMGAGRLSRARLLALVVDPPGLRGGCAGDVLADSVAESDGPRPDGFRTRA